MVDPAPTEGKERGQILKNALSTTGPHDHQRRRLTSKSWTQNDQALARLSSLRCTRGTGGSCRRCWAMVNAGRTSRERIKTRSTQSHIKSVCNKLIAKDL